MSRADLLIPRIAKDVLLKSLYSEVTTPDGLEIVINTDPDNVLNMIDLLNDQGMFYITTPDTLKHLWSNIIQRDNENYTFSTWLLSVTNRFTTRAFGCDHLAYDAWIKSLLVGYTSSSNTEINSITINTNDLDGFIDSIRSKYTSKSSTPAGYDESIIIHDDLLDRLPKSYEFYDMITNNPWFVFLLTLDTVWDEIFVKLIENSYSDRNGRVAHKLGVADDG